MTAELVGTSSPERTLDKPTIAAMRPARRKGGKKTGKKVAKPGNGPVQTTRLNDSLLALARQLSNDDPARVRVFSATKFEVLNVPWKDHPTGRARVVGEAPGTGTIRRYRNGRLVWSADDDD